MFRSMSSFLWPTTEEVDFNRAAGREAARPRACMAPRGSNTLPVPQRFKPSATWRVTCCAYVQSRTGKSGASMRPVKGYGLTGRVDNFKAATRTVCRAVQPFRTSGISKEPNMAHDFVRIASRIRRLERVMKAAWELYHAPGGDYRRWDYVYTCLHKYEPLYYALKADCAPSVEEQADAIINQMFDKFNERENLWEGIIFTLFDDDTPHEVYRRVMGVLPYVPHIVRRIYEDAAEYYKCTTPHGDMDVDYAVNNLPYLWELAEGENYWELNTYGMYRLYVPFTYAEYPIVWHCPATWDAPETWDATDYDWAEALPLREAM